MPTLTLPDTGTKDATAQLNNLLTRATAEDVIDLQGRTIVCNGSLLIPNDVTIEGNGAVITTEVSRPPGMNDRQVRARAHVRLIGLGITINQLNVQGPATKVEYDATLEAQHGFDCQSA